MTKQEVIDKLDEAIIRLTALELEEKQTREARGFKSIPLFLNRMVQCVPNVALDKNTGSAIGDVYKERVLNDGKKVFILTASVYRVFFDFEEVPREFTSGKGIHWEFDQTPLWNRGMHLNLTVKPQINGLLNVTYPSTGLTIEKDAYVGTLYYKELE